jgi:hypothetical protein
MTNKQIPLIARIGEKRYVDVHYNSPSSENNNLNQSEASNVARQNQENKQNINIHINTSAGVSDADKYPEPWASPAGSTADPLGPRIIMRAVGGGPDLLASNTTTEEIKPTASLPNFNKNPLLNVIKPSRVHKDTGINIDTNFLKHVIKVLLANHKIEIDNRDIEDILKYFGSVEIITDKEIIRTRDVKNKGSCCCDVDQEEIMTFIRKILLNGYNLVKYLPELVEFINEIGLVL